MQEIRCTPENSTSFAGTSRGRFEGLRLSALSASWDEFLRPTLPCRDCFSALMLPHAMLGQVQLPATFGSPL